MDMGIVCYYGLGIITNMTIGNIGNERMTR